MATFTPEHTTVTSPRASLTGLGRLGKRQRQRAYAAKGLHRDRRRSSLSYGIMVIDMGVHQLSELAQKIDLVQVSLGCLACLSSIFAGSWKLLLVCRCGERDTILWRYGKRGYSTRRDI